ncbi:MAG: hypothetical protein FI707_10860 [SAR202 cluster bacterium]|jgi:energy-converting hydrogenase Eha subunit F|nr:hypothetical protein [Vicinamibacterales bacterium]MDP6800051.1 hypothetical protein [SAR202 cluster bacterium]MQG58443.1 hypothetical protein [SAR202 cluster bacterium]MQG69277.1 hypothetical protein [SAR202 cluster bacterium]HJO37751.1 hypothetical protein [Vicinamibacterales bacterium]|tara:strand:- start:11714 stop:11935 length:222 start_codon:yes stop_codon:yes gene_type:complete
MIQHQSDHVDGNSDLGHSDRGGAPQVVPGEVKPDLPREEGSHLFGTVTASFAPWFLLQGSGVRVEPVALDGEV